MKFDGYNDRVIVNNNTFRIAFEYDGIQHDIWPNPNPNHKIKGEFKRQQENDLRKMKIANEYNTIVIKLKAINGFNFNTINNFQQEIIKQFKEIVGIKLPLMKEFIHNPQSEYLIPGERSLDTFLAN